MSGVTLATAGTGLATTVSAQSGDSEPKQGILANGLDVEGGDNRAFINGLFASFTDVSSTSSAETLADRLANEFNANSEAWLSYGNWLVAEYDSVEPMGTVSLGVDVIVSHRLEDDETVPTVIEAQYDDGTESYDLLEWRIEDPESPDYQVGLKDTAAKHGADDLQSFRRKFIDEDGEHHEIPDNKYVSELAGFYSSSMLWGDESKHILQLLIGDEEGI